MRRWNNTVFYFKHACCQRIGCEPKTISCCSPLPADISYSSLHRIHTSTILPYCKMQVSLNLYSRYSCSITPCFVESYRTYRMTPRRNVFGQRVNYMHCLCIVFHSNHFTHEFNGRNQRRLHIDSRGITYTIIAAIVIRKVMYSLRKGIDILHFRKKLKVT